MYEYVKIYNFVKIGNRGRDRQRGDIRETERKRQRGR
jgi:hypothetical protein